LFRLSADFDAKLQSAGCLGKGSVEVELSPRTTPGAVTGQLRRGLLQDAALGLDGEQTGGTAAIAATMANVTKTDGKPPTSIIPTTVGPITEAKRSQAVAAPTASARTRVG
jgi:hypothetical protein